MISCMTDTASIDGDQTISKPENGSPTKMLCLSCPERILECDGGPATGKDVVEEAAQDSKQQTHYRKRTD